MITAKAAAEITAKNRYKVDEMQRQYDESAIRKQLDCIKVEAERGEYYCLVLFDGVSEEFYGTLTLLGYTFARSRHTSGGQVTEKPRGVIWWSHQQKLKNYSI